MPYRLRGNCVVKSGTGKTVKCHKDHAKAVAHLKALYANVEDVSNEMNYKDAEAKFLTTKEGDRYRWTMITGSAFIDRDGEIISTKAFEDDCDQMELNGDYGELLWWHCDGTKHSTDKEARPYLPLGSCDTSFVYEKLNYESGLYYDDAVGGIFNEKAAEFGASKSFYHKEEEPDEDGVYTFIRTKERSILPRTKEANLLTRLFGHKEMKEKEMANNKDRIAALTEKLGPEKTAELLEHGKELSKKAEEFLASKEQKEKEAELEAVTKETAADVSLTLKEMALTTKELATALDETTRDAKALFEGTKAGFASQGKEVNALKADVAELQQSVAALLGIQPKAAPFKASEKGKAPELTADQIKLAADAEKSFQSPDVVDWLIKGTSLEAA